MSVPLSLPRASDVGDFGADPFAFLARARAIHGDLFVVRDQGPLFSRAPGCEGVVAIFGPHQRAVLSDIETFGLPPSAAEALGLPPPLGNLNRSLHSMRGDEHAAHKRALASMLAEVDGAIDMPIRRAVDASVALLPLNRPIGLLESMRRLTLAAASPMLFGDTADRADLARLLQAYFDVRREITSPANRPRLSVEPLVAIGEALDRALRTYVRECRRAGAPHTQGIIPRLARLEARDLAGLKPCATAFTEDEVVGHSNVLFISSTEPIAVALTWILLVLSQHPGLRAALRRELAQSSAGGALLDGVIHETLRVLPPNAFMARITTRAASVNGVALPEGCEVVLCPFVAHRDPRCFERPERFLPERWARASPSPYDYFPFGAGGHACVGRSLALHTIRVALAALLSRVDVRMASDQDVDWRVHIMFMPRTDPSVVLAPIAATSSPGGKLGGPVAHLIKFGAATY